ncbi:MAG: Por secretion system protein, partial [Bacteroidales bacterium]|nr:Por secretion system protein [Bacteroidales bacterium]
MRKILISVLLFCGAILTGNAQVITTDPSIPVARQPVTIYFDATEGTGGLKDFTGDVYAHTGVLTDKSSSGSDWKYVKTNWGENTPETKMTRVSANLYSLEIIPAIQDYYGVPGSDTITHMAFVFRSADNSLEGKDVGGKDIFVQVFKEGLHVTIIRPEKTSVTSLLTDVVFEAATSETATFSLFLNSGEVKSESGTSISHTFNFDVPGDYWIKVTASTVDTTVSDSVFVHVMDEQVNLPVPDGLVDGINYITDQSVQLVLFAPGKEHVFAIGDFNDWIPQARARMAKDNDRFWITLENLMPGTEYSFQYFVDGMVSIADPYTEKILDPWSDHWILSETYPDLKPFPDEYATSPVSIIQTAQTEYEWNNTGFVPPDPGDLVVYELLLRDFILAHDWKTLVDSLDYFSRLGINAIELMPVNEFDGNESWGYNPTFYFAPDKYYGPAGDLKVFIDSCHGRGIAVIADMVLNHSYGPSPLVQLYLDGSTGKTTPDNPWYNVDSPNQVFSWGYDFNHESQATMDFVDRVNRFWLEEYQVDGFRFDFTKGFTNTPGDGGAYDAARITILKRMADVIWGVNPDTYVILEHFADNNEEKELSSYGIMLWGNSNYNYNEATMGYNENGKSDFNWMSYKNRGWNDPHVVGYMESHDEERLMFKNLSYGNASGVYDIQDLNTALERMELSGAFFFTIPGPKMIWQFGELGYDFSIDYDCRVCNKPLQWDYYDVGNRRKLYQVWSALINLKINEPAFESGNFYLNVSGAVKRIEINHSDMDVRIIGNFDVVEQPGSPSFSHTGWWYDYFSGDSINV